jgi:hypothetical protein
MKSLMLSGSMPRVQKSSTWSRGDITALPAPAVPAGIARLLVLDAAALATSSVCALAFSSL